MKFRKIAFALFLSFLSFIGYSQIQVGNNFDIFYSAPIDTRFVVDSLPIRDNIVWRYEGMTVFVISNQTNYQLRGGTANSNWVSINTSSYTTGTGLTLIGNTLSHSPHTGDVIGTSNLTIAAIQGRTLATTIPTSGNVLGWNGTAWAPSVATGTQYTSGTGISLSGTTFSADNTTAIWNANKLNGTSISTTAPAGNEILKWNGTEWTPASDNNTTYTAGTGMILSGTTFSADNTAAIWNANKLNGTSISTTAPAGNEILKWNGTEWTPASDNNTTYASGIGISLTGNTFSADNTAAIWNANKLNGTSISTTAPVGNEILKWNGTEWTPASDNNTTYTAGTGMILSGTTFSADNTAAIWNANKLNGTSISTTAPAGNEILKWNGTEWTPASDNNTTYASGIGISLTGNTFSADNTAAIWNANKLNGTSISTTAPAGNEILKWNGTVWTPASDNNTTYTAGTGMILSGTTFSADNTSAIWNANKLNGTSISTIAPAGNEILKWNGTEWTPASDNNTTYTAGTGMILSGTTFSADNTSAIWNANKINGTSISTIAPANNEVLKWNGSEWIPASDNNTTYTAGTGMILSGTTFSADNTSAIWNSNKLKGNSISSVAPSSNQVLTWNGTEWIPAATTLNYYSAGTGLALNSNTFTAQNSSAIWNANQLQGTNISASVPSNNQILKYSAGSWVASNETSYSSGMGISLSGNSFSHSSHTGDATGSTSLTITGIQGRQITTATPSTGNVLKWNGTLWAMGTGTTDTFNGNRTVSRSGIPNINVATTATLADFINAYFFPFITATMSIDGNLLYEVGTTNVITISGSRTPNNETVFSNGRVDLTYPSTVTIYTFGAASNYSTNANFTPIQGNSNSLELHYVAYQTVGNNGSPTTINSSTKYVNSVYPYFHGTTTINFTSGGTAAYTGLTKTVSANSNKTETYNGTGYLYFCYPQSYGSLTNILDNNSFSALTAFTKYSVNISSAGLLNNWTEPYFIYISNSISTPSNLNFQFYY